MGQAAGHAGLVDEAVANREQIELDLLNTITRMNELSDELSRLSVGLDRISEQLGFADVELAGIEEDIAVRAVDAYMNALSSAKVVVVNSTSVEEAMVTGAVAGEVISSNQTAFDELIFIDLATGNTIAHSSAIAQGVQALELTPEIVRKVGGMSNIGLRLAPDAKAHTDAQRQVIRFTMVPRRR